MRKFHSPECSVCEEEHEPVLSITCDTCRKKINRENVPIFVNETSVYGEEGHDWQFCSTKCFVSYFFLSSKNIKGNYPLSKCNIVI